MTFSDKDIIKLKRFTESIIADPRPLDKQSCVSKNGKLWCEDWEIIEICKYIFNGKSMYYGDPPPNRLKNNDLWSKEKIEEQAEKLMRDLVVMDNIIAELKRWRQ